MVDDLDPEIPELFDKQQWIGVGRKYDTLKLPYFVLLEHSERTAIPEDFLNAAKLPSPHMHVSDIVRIELPRISSEITVTAAKTWFSHDTPNINLDILLTHPVPTHAFVNNLQDLLGQAWFQHSPSFELLCLLDAKIMFSGQSSIELSAADLERFQDLKKGQKSLFVALKNSKKRQLQD